MKKGYAICSDMTFVWNPQKVLQQRKCNYKILNEFSATVFLLKYEDLKLWDISR